MQRSDELGVSHLKKSGLKYYSLASMRLVTITKLAVEHGQCAEGTMLYIHQALVGGKDQEQLRTNMDK